MLSFKKFRGFQKNAGFQTNIASNPNKTPISHDHEDFLSDEENDAATPHKNKLTFRDNKTPTDPAESLAKLLANKAGALTK